MRSLTIVGMAPPSPVSAEVVRKIAALARLSVPEADLPLWTAQLGRIVSYIDQLKELPDAQVGMAEAALATPLREDEPVSGNGLRALEQNTRLLHGHGAVPRVVGAADTSPPPAGK